MPKLLAPAFKVDGFTTGYDHRSGRALLVLHIEGNKIPLAFTLSQEYAQRIGSSLVEIYADHHSPPHDRLN